MLFNRQGLQQKNWRMVKKGKYILFGCSLFFVVGGVSACVPQVTYAGEINDLGAVTKQEKNSNIGEENSTIVTPTLEKEKETQSSNDELLENTTKNKIGDDKAIDKKEINAKELKNLVDKIKNTDTSKKTEKSVKELNLVLLRAEKALDNKEVTQEEIDKEVKTLKEVFDKLEDKPREDNKSEVKEKVEFKKDEKVNSEKDIKEKQQDNNTKDVARRYNEKITKATNIVKEINSLASEINYEFSDTEKELVSNIGKLPPTDNNSEESIQKLLNEAIYLRNKVANRVTRAHSGKRDPRNGKVIENSGESTFRGIVYKHKENRRDGNLIENGNTAVYYNSDEIWSLIEIKGERVGNERKFTTYARGKVVEDVTPYYIVTVGFTENSPIKGLKMQVAYWDKKAGVQRSREIEYGKTEINNPITNAAIRGVVGEGGIVQPGRYEVHIASNTRVAPNQLKPYTFTFIIKPQSERNTVKDLSQTYVDDVRHLTETEKTALIEKFKTEHPDVMTPSGHKSDFDHAEISSDGTTMTIHFKDGLSTKTIQTNAQNDVVAKHPSLTTLFGDPHDFYKNPRNLVKSKTNHEVPQTARVTWKTPFDLSQAGTKNAVVTVSYDNGVTKDVTTPYTVLDFIGKQDKRIYQNQSGELGDARSYITLSNGTAPATDLTIRWKGGPSVDTSAQGVQRKEIEILRGNTVMKTVTIPVAIVDNINPTITAPDSVLLTRAEGLPSNISIDAQDNARGIGLKDANPIVVENLANPLRYNPSTKRIELSGVIPNNFQRTQATIKAIDKNGNTATKTITFNVQAQTDKYTAVANPQKQTVSYLATPSAEASVSTAGLPTGTRYTWKTTPNTSSPGDKTGVVEVTYPDTSKDTVNVTIAVRKLSDEYTPTGSKITRNQNVPVTNNDLKAAVSVNNNGNSKVKSVTASSISTVNAGTQTIRATVTYLDNTTDPVDIPLEVKDVTAPTIQTPNDRQNWDLIALDRTLPSITVTSVDNNGGTGIKSTTVTGLPDFLVYDNATKTIKFKNGVQEVTKLPVGQDSKTYNATIQVTDNANNPSQRQITITVKSMTTKYNATPSGQKQTVSYGVTPDAGTSINKNGLPAGTRYTWATMPSTTSGPGDKAGVVEVTYPDDSIDTVNVTVNVRRLADEYTPTGTKITREQNTAVTNDDLKAAVTISNNGNNKVKSVIPVGTISTAEFGNKTINATVTYLDDTTDSVTIPLEVRDVTKPTIQTPIENQLWEVTSLDKTFPPIKIKTVDNVGGSGVKNIEAKNLPSFLKYDKATSSIVFQDGVYEVPKLSGISRTTRNVTFIVEDNAGNRSERNIQIRQISMAEKYNPQANTIVQKVNHGESPNPKTSVNTVDLPGDTRYAWNTTPDTSKPGDKTSVVTVTYPDDSVDEVTAIVKVRKLSDEYNVSGAQIEVDQNTPVTNDDLKAKVTATSKVGNVSGTDKISTVTASPIDTSTYGDQTINAVVTFKDGTTKDVTIPLKVKDATNPTIQSPTNGQNWDLIAVEGQDPNIAVTSEDNAGGSGVKSTTVTGLPNFLEYNESTKKIQFKEGVTQVPSLPEGTDVQPHNVTIEVEDNAGNKTSTQVMITVKSMTTKYDATPNPDKQTVSYGATPDATTSVDKTNLPEGTSYAWKTRPDTNTPGEKDGVIEVTYKDGSKDTVNVKVTVKELSSEYEVTGLLIEVNQNTPVTNDDLKAKVTATSKVGNVSGTDKISTVTASPIDTSTYGDQTINAVVTFKDGTTKDVTIPLKVKDATNPTIQSPTNGQNWDLIAVEGQDPNIAVTSEDNAGGSGVKSTTVTGLPNFLEYNESTKKIQFKEGVTQVPSLPEGTDVQPHNVTIEVEDNAGNKTSTQVMITVKSMTTKYDATPNPDKQTVSYGATPDATTSVDKTNLPEGTSYAWKTRPDTNTPGEKDGVVEVTYKDGSKDTVNVKVNVNKLSDEYDVTGSLIEVNQNTPVTNDDLKAKVTATSKEGNVSGIDKISTVTASLIDTSTYGDQTISAVVTFKDGTTKDVTIPLKVKDVTKPTISAPTENTNWEMTALDKTLPNMGVSAEDNANGSGVKTVSVEGLPDYLEYDSAANSIKFKAGKQEVEKLPENTPSKEFNLNIRVEDNAGNVSERAAKITVSSISAKTNPQPKDQMVNYGQVPNPEDSVNKQGLPDGTTVTWKTPPVVTTPGTSTGVVEVTYPDGSKDTVEVTVNVSKLSDEYNVTGTEIVVNQNTPVTNDDLKAKVTATSKVGNVSGTDKISTVTASPIDTSTYGDQTINAVVTFKDGTTKDVTIPLKVKDATNPTIQSPTNGQNWDLIAVEGQDPNIAVTSEDNAGGSGVKSTTVTGLPNFLEYNESTKKIQFKEGVTQVPSLPLGTDVQPHNVTIEVEDNAGNKTTTNVTITVKSMTTKYDATPNPDKQTVSYGATPDAGTSVDKTNLPEGTNYAWTTTPDTNTPGEKDGVVEVTYKDGSKDVVNVTVNVRKLSDEYEPTATKIVKNQSDSVSNEELKAAVTISNNGASKVKSVTPVGTINTINSGNQTINAIVTYLDDTTDMVTIPLEVKDVTKPTILSPEENTNWEMTALDKTLPNMEVRAEDNANGSGVKTVSVEGLPDYLEYDSATNSIKFKAGKQEVEKLPENASSKEFNLNIRVEDNSGNVSERAAKITVSSISGKKNPTPIQQNTSYGQMPDPNASVDKVELPDGTNVTWKTPPVVTAPGTSTGVVEVTYPDGSKDTVEVTVNVRALNDEYNVTGNEIVVNQNAPVTNDDLKAKVTATSKEGNVSGTDKISTVTAPEINTANYGNQTINATVTFKDGTTKDVTIPLKVKDATNPTIQSPTNGQNWDLIAVEGQDPNIAVTSEDNAGGSGVKSTTVTGLPNFLEYNESTKKIQFKEGVTQVPSLPLGTDVQPHNVTIEVEDNAGNKTSAQVTITVKSMTTKYEAIPNSDKQTVSYGATPDAGISVNTSGLPEGTNYAWTTTPDTNTPGEKDGVVEVTYKDGSKDTVNVKVTVKELSSEYGVTGVPIEVNQNTPVTNDDLKAKVTATSTVGNVDGTDKIAKVEPKARVSTAAYGETNIEATVTFKDGTTKEVTIPLKVKDVTPPTITAPEENKNWEMTALNKTLPNMEVRAEDNANGSGIKTVSVEGLPDYLEYDSTTNSIKFKSGKQEVEKLPDNTPSKEFNLNIRVEDNAGNVNTRTAKITVSSISAKTNPQPKDQMVNYGQVPNPEDSVNKQGLPDGTTVTWKTPPVVNTPGSTTGEVEITYPDGSKDVVTVNVTVRKVSEEYTATGTQIEVNQNEEVTSDMLKGAVNATNAQGENGNAKIAKVESTTPINTTIYGDQTIQAKVTYIDGSEQDVTIPLKVKDVTDPTILTPEENKIWEMTALDKTLPVMKIKAEDNANGSGIATIEVRNMPSFLTFDESTGTITFKEGVQEVPEIKSDNTMHGVTIIARDKAGNSTSTLVNITVWSMRGKYDPQPKPQTVDNGTVPNAEDSVDKTGLPEGTTVTWKTNPDVSTPGSHPTVALVTYPDGTVDEITVPITVKEQKDTFNPTAKQPGQTAKHGSDPSAEGSINTDGLPKGTTYTWVEKPDTNTTPGSKPGKVLITYPDNSTEEVTVTVEVTPQKDDYDPQPKLQTVDNGTVPNAEDSVEKTGLPEGTTVTWKTNPDVSTPGSHPTVALVTYPDGTVDEITVPITVKEQKDTFNPTAKQPGQTAKHGSDPSAEGSINTDGLPKGTTYTWVEKPDTNTTPGSKPGKVLITYPDNSTEEVTVTVEVTPQKDDYDPQTKPQTVDNGTVPNAEDSVDKTGLPSGTTIAWKETPVVNTPGSHPTVALVTYPDGTVDEVTVPITVKEQKDTFNPTAKQPGQTAKHGSEPSAEGSINTEGLPSGTTYTWVEKPDTNTTPGSKPGKVLITYPDNSTEEVTVTVEVTPQKDDYDPQPKPQTVDNGTVPNAEDSVDKTGLPSGTTIAWKETPVVNTPGSHPTVALVTYPDGTVDEVTVPITVKEQKDTFNPTAKQPGQTAKHGSDPSAEGSINTEGLPKGTTYTWVEKPDTNTTPGSKPGKVLITYPDNSTEEVTVTVEVTPQKDDYNPQPKPQTITNGDIPNAKDSIGNVKELPDGTKIEWEDGVVPSTNVPGKVTAKITITYPDGTQDEVEVTIIVNKQTEKGEPEEQPTLPEFNGGVNGEPEEQPTLPEFNGGVNGEPEEQPALPEFAGGVNGEPEVQPTLPDFAGGVKGEPEVQPTLPEFSGGVNGEPEVQPTLPEFSGGVKGEPEVQPTLLEFVGGVNGIPEEQPILPEFAGGVKGEPEVQPALPEFVGGVKGEPEVQPTLPEFSGGVNGAPETLLELPEYVERINDESKIQPVIPNKSSKITKRLANTGETTNNSELSGLGLAIVGLFAAIKRRKKNEE